MQAQELTISFTPLLPEDRIPIYRDMIREILHDDRVSGVLLAGSYAKNMAKPDSDLDLYFITQKELSVAARNSLAEEYDKKYPQLTVDLTNQAIQSLRQFEECSKIGTDYEWDRYNIARSVLLIDKSSEGNIAEIINAKTSLTKNEANAIIDRSLGSYISLTYRFIRSRSLKDELAAQLDCSESMSYLLDSLFAMHERIRPYNTYLRWELINYPLSDLPWDHEQFLGILGQAQKGHTKSVQELYRYIAKLAHEKGWRSYFDAWGKNSRKIKLINDFRE